MNKTVRIFVALSIILSLIITSACSNKPSEVNVPAKTETVTITFGGTLPEDNPLTKGMYKFKEDLESRTNGKVEVKVFPNGQMGGGREMLEALQQGNLTMVECSMGPLSSFDSTMTAFNLPYLFDDRAAVYDFLDNYEISTKLKNIVEDKTGIKILAYWENGFRQITNSKRPIVKADDLKGLKIRTMENPIHIATFSAWGANPTPMAFGELFTALQQGTVDGQENPLANIASQKFEEVQKYITISKHFYDPDGLYISSKFFNSLEPELQKAIIESAKVATEYQRKLSEEADNTLIAVYQNNSKIELNELSDEVKNELREKAKPAFDKVESNLGPEIFKEFMDGVNEVNKKHQ
jgi:tripartite ATP-independent transporter DctP family solute receptor